MRTYVRYVLYLIVFIGYSFSFAGSYEDFFDAIPTDNAGKISQLLERGFDPNTLSPQGHYGLMMAIMAPAPKVADVLVRWAGTNTEVRNPRDESPLMLAALKGNLDLCELLVLARDADVNKPGWTPLHYAASAGQVPIIRFLLDHYAYIDASSPNGSTPLMMAAGYGTTDAVSALLEAGADPLLKNDLGLTAVDFATRVGRDKAAKLIVDAIRARNATGKW